MNDDWRVTVELREHGFAHRLGEQLGAAGLEHDLQDSFRDRVIVSVEGSEVFCYAGTRTQAEATIPVIRRLAAAEHWDAEIALAHWHAVAEEWQDPDTPEASPATERGERVADERDDSARQGYPEFEVRIQCRSRHDSGELSHRLAGDGIPNIHRWSYVLVGATDEDSAQALAARLRDEAPEAGEVTVERNLRAIYENRPSSPFTLLGGMGG